MWVPHWKESETPTLNFFLWVWLLKSHFLYFTTYFVSQLIGERVIAVVFHSFCVPKMSACPKWTIVTSKHDISWEQAEAQININLSNVLKPQLNWIMTEEIDIVCNLNCWFFHHFNDSNQKKIQKSFHDFLTKNAFCSFLNFFFKKMTKKIQRMMTNYLSHHPHQMKRWT